MNLLDKTKFLLIAIIALTAVSCSEEDVESSSIQGSKYETTYAKFTTTGDGQNSVNEFDTKEELTENELYGTMEFKAEGVFFADEVEVGTWEQSGSNVTITEDGEAVTAAIEGDMLKMTITETYGSITSTIELHFTKM